MRRRRARSTRVRIGRLLAAIAAQPDPARVPAALGLDPTVVDLADLAAAATFHRMAPAVHVALKDVALPHQSREALRQEHHAQAFRHAATLSNLVVIGEVMADVGCRWAVLKGPYLSEYVYPRSDLRTYADLDIVIDRRSVPAVVAALRDLGAAFIDRNWPLIRAGERAQTGLLLPMGIPLDLHWHLLNRGPIRHAFRLDMDAVLDRAEHRPIGGTSAPGLSDVDALIHLCLHASIEGASRLVWLWDIHDLVTRHRPSDDEVVAQARASGAGLVVAVMLQRTRRVLGTDVSDELLDALAPRAGWRAVTHLVDVLRPTPESYERLRTGRTVIRATRASGRASLHEFRTSATRNAWARIVRDSSRPGIARDSAPAAGLNPLHQAVGTDADRDAFFSWVATSPDI